MNKSGKTLSLQLWIQYVLALLAWALAAAVLGWLVISYWFISRPIRHHLSCHPPPAVRKSQGFREHPARISQEPLQT